MTKETYIGQISKLKMNKMKDYNKIQLAREVDIISQLNHPLFVKFHGYSPVNFKLSQRPVIVTESTKNGTLKDILDQQRKKIENPIWNETTKLINIIGIALGMKYLHSEEIIHCFLNPSSILLDENLYPKITNFDFVTNEYEKDNQEFNGYYPYSAPETFKSQYTKASDVYSYGMIVYEIITNKNIYENIPQYKILSETTKGIRPEMTQDIPTSYRQLIENCWNQEPTKRPTFDAIVDILMKDNEIINENINQEEYFKFIKKIEDHQKNNKDHIISHKINLTEEEQKQEQGIKQEQDKSTTNTNMDETNEKESKFREISVNFDSIKETTEEEEEDIKTEFLDLKLYKIKIGLYLTNLWIRLN